MSRVGLNPIMIPEGVQYSFEEQLFSVNSQKGNLSLKLDVGFDIVVEDSLITVKRPNDEKKNKAKHGLYRSLIANMFEGLSKGYRKELELHGVGYRASNSGQKLDLSLGYSHNIIFQICDEVSLKTENEKGQNPKIILESYNKELIGAVAAKIKSLRKHDPYKGKGIRFVGEQVRRKAGKTASS
ncbi:MAG: 50S ribosomal protein L6 [Flavobacteriales bacterium]|jgi:large subunit ribosomal protein L6|nr:50S ribosomal protein L6 [Flavobacteriales bacterium]MBE38090.1 50S ribosomal protein L6 [Flavobacteriales bacterium]|tara:strand:- start:1620 stop:2171 length:552 start_codon:yes stop_codon:yes gene_type:complete